MRTLITFVLAMTATIAQPPTLFLTFDQAERSASGAGGVSSSPGNEAAVFRRSSIVAVSPEPMMAYSAYEICSLATWAAYLGDDDNNGNYAQNILGQIDALHIAPGATNPPSLFDFYLSAWSDTGPTGTSGPTGVSDGDVVRYVPGGGFVAFLTESLIATGVGNPLPSGFDLDAFSIDDATGDIYWSANGTILVGGLPVGDGAVLRIPGTAYTTDPQGNVSAVTPSSVQVVLSEAEVNTMWLNAGLNGISDLSGLQVLPGAGTFVSTSTGLALSHLWMTDRDSNDGAVVVSTVGGGSVAVTNGVALNGGPAFGLGPSAWSQAANSSPVALAYSSQALTTTPRMLDLRTLSITPMTPTILELDIGGAALSSSVFMLMATSTTSNGSFAPRLSLSDPNNPLSSILPGPGGHPELYTFDLADPLVQFSLNVLLQVPTDSQGHGRLTLSVPPLPLGLSVVFQYLEEATFALSTPVAPVVR